jgi:hypothetical protein
VDRKNQNKNKLLICKKGGNMSDKLCQNKEEHPSYGQLSITRISSNSRTPLYGTSNECREYIRITIMQSELHRDLHRSWHFGGDPYIEVIMSPAQFAEAITSLNIGDGVPVTITRVRTHKCADEDTIDSIADKAAVNWTQDNINKPLDNEAFRNLVLAIKGAINKSVQEVYTQIPQPPFKDERDLFDKEFKADVVKVMEDADNLIKQIKELAGQKTVSKKALSEMVSNWKKNWNYGLGQGQCQGQCQGLCQGLEQG